MKLLSLVALILIAMNIGLGQDLKTLIADGTAQIPKKYDLEPSVKELSTNELEAVKTTALEKEIAFEPDSKQMSSEESNFRRDFELLDVADGFFISREIEFRAYLYTAYSQKIKRNYQGVLVMSISNNGTKFTPKAHYVYEYRGDKFIRPMADLNGNFLSEMAIFSEPPTKKISRKTVRIIEFSPDGIVKIGSAEIYSSVPQKQRTPWSADKTKPAKRVYTPPVVKAVKLYALKKPVKAVEFFKENWVRKNENWIKTDGLQTLPNGLDEDGTNYFEIIKPIFPKSLGGK